MFEYGSAAFQLAIVLAGAAALTTRHVADLHLGAAWASSVRRSTRPGLRRADPGPSLGQENARSAGAAGTSFELWSALFSGAGRPWPA